MADYLIRRDGRYSYRRRYPREVAEALKRSEFVKALGTADPKEAARLARAVSVQFDNECEKALRELAEAPATTSEAELTVDARPSNAEVAKDVLSRLPGIIRQMTELVIAEQARNKAGWMDQIDWRRRALKEHIAGRMPSGINMHPLEARVALKAMEAAVRGEPLSFAAADEPQPTEESRDTFAQRDNSASATLDQKKLDAALAEYAADKSHRRKELARRIALRALSLPCKQSSAVAAISDWCKQELEIGKRPSSVWTEASSVIALLKCVPGWHEFSVPKVGELKQLKGAGKARRDAKAPMPVSVLHKVLRGLPGHLPRDGEYWHAAFLLCALYGLRPREILQAGPESLQSQADVFGNEQLVFRVGLNGAKNTSSERDLPVPPDLKPLFDLALSRGSCNSETARTRVERLNRFVSAAQGPTEAKHTLYSVRHLFADIARACGYSDSDFGPLMGHKSMSGITAVYGGAGSLDNERGIFDSVRTKLFPAGFSSFLPAKLLAQTDAPEI